MGGDLGPRAVLSACFQALAKHPHLYLQLVGDPAQWPISIASAQLTEQQRQRIEILSSRSVVSMQDKPATALRHRGDSSMSMAMQQVSKGLADACVSSGNTGALMAFGLRHLSLLPGISRPAIVSQMPTANGHCYMLDLGANIEASAEQLCQFALMGAVLAQALDAIDKPRIALLNVGAEAHKGRRSVRAAGKLLAADEALNFQGFIEGDGVFAGQADVVVCEGFVGNVLLKSSEGLARLIAQRLQESYARSWWRRLLGLATRPLLAELQRQLDPSRYNGAALLGLNGVVVKSHGRADARSFGYAIEQAITEVGFDLPAVLAARLR